MKNQPGRKAQSTFNIELSTVHDALSEAQQQKISGRGLENTTIRVDPRDKEIAQRIFAVNGTTISDYLRCCLKALVRDYAGPKVATKEIQLLQAQADGSAS